MCGIAGIINVVSHTPPDLRMLQRMCDAIAHRGPDDQGCFIEPSHGVGFGHRRLSIIDVAGGRQPMTDATGDLTVVFNGEIYNFPELKKDLLGKGYRFTTASDTEVILCLYHAYGRKAIARLNGIFAFALLDRRDGDIVLARDHFGVKPLYYAPLSGRIVFGSEIKAILASGLLTPDVDPQALDTFLTLRYTPSPETLFKGIRRLPPGSLLVVSRKDGWSIRSYWDYAPKTVKGIDEQEAVHHYQELLEAAVRRQMISDVPVGLLLSGGIDSAVIGMLMREQRPERLQTFSIGFSGRGDFNELADARDSAHRIGSDHHELTISQEQYLDFLLRSFKWSEEPIAESAIPALFHVCHLAAQQVKVVLAGQGADEPLAGYKRYFGEKYLSQYASLLRMLPLHSLARAFPRNERFKRAAYASTFRREIDRFKAIYTIVTPEQKERLYAPGFKSSLRATTWESLDRLYAMTGGLEDSLSRLLFIDTRMYLSDDLLVFGDKMSMAHSLEMRVPFLDLDLVQFLETLPGSFKLRGFTHKYIHKRALRKWLPDEIIRRKKRGFATPIDEWLQADMGELTRRLVTEPSSASRIYFDVGAIGAMIDRHRGRQENYQRQLFALLSFELWHRTFIQQTELEQLMPQTQRNG